MHCLLAVMLTLGFRVQFIESSCELINDELEQLKCKIRVLEQSVNMLKTSDIHQNKSLIGVRKKASVVSTNCNLIQPNVCGPCTCFDDYLSENKYYCDCQNLTPMRDCLQFYVAGNRISGLYRITMKYFNKGTQVYCDQQTDNGGWTVIQRRINGKTNFYRNWKSYKIGFGNRRYEFWLGNTNIYLLALQATYPNGSQLRIDMTDWAGQNVYAKYKPFMIDNEKEKYKLHVGGYTGNAGDSLTYNNEMKFSTYDADNDLSGGKCARERRSAWWYNGCTYANLNGEYLWIGVEQPAAWRGVLWHHHKEQHSMKFVEMKVRRIV